VTEGRVRKNLKHASKWITAIIEERVGRKLTTKLMMILKGLKEEQITKDIGRDVE